MLATAYAQPIYRRGLRGSIPGMARLGGLVRSPYTALALAPLLWSGNFVVAKAVGDALPPFTLSALRWSIGLLVLLPLLRGRDLLLPRNWWPHVVVLAVTGVYLYSALVYAALRSTSTLNASIIQAAIPAVTALLAVVFLRARVAAIAWLGIAVAFAGVAWIVAGGQPDTLAALRVGSGDLLMLVNVLLWAGYTLVGQPLLRARDGIVVTFYSVLVGLAFLWPTALWEMQGRAWPVFTLELAAALAYVGVFPSVVAYLLWNRGVAAVGASAAALFVNLLPVYTAALAALLLGERVALYHVVGGLLVAAGVYLGSRRR
jgi:drug/metabolite transporter (DMT)-like permease